MLHSLIKSLSGTWTPGQSYRSSMMRRNNACAGQELQFVSVDQNQGKMDSSTLVVDVRFEPGCCWFEYKLNTGAGFTQKGLQFKLILRLQ